LNWRPSKRARRDPECRAIRQPHLSKRRYRWLVSPHPFDEAYGEGTPLAKLVDAHGRVLTLGAPLGTITLLHHAEALADVPNKQRVTYRMPIPRDDDTVWVELHDIDTSSISALPYEKVIPPETDSFEFIAREALDAGIGATGVGESTSHLFEASELVRFAVRWIEDRFRG
jgi:aminoglycoside 3-N-acetyltransferase